MELPDQPNFTGPHGPVYAVMATDLTEVITTKGETTLQPGGWLVVYRDGSTSEALTADDFWSAYSLIGGTPVSKPDPTPASPAEPVHVGGGWYEVNGERIRGKAAAYEVAGLDAP